MTRIAAVAGTLALICLGVSCEAKNKRKEPQQPPVAAFRAECAAKAAGAADAGTIAVQGLDEWLFFAPGLRHMSIDEPFWGESAAKVSRATRPEYADPLPAVLDFKSQLGALGIELLMVPVPDKSAVYPDKLTQIIRVGSDGRRPRLDVEDEAFYAVLRSHDMEVLDLTGVFLAARASTAARTDEFAGQPLYCRTDTHWSPLACAIAAEQIARHIADRRWLKEITKTRFATEQRAVAIEGDLARDLPAETHPQEMVVLRQVGTHGPAGLEPVKDDAASPVLLLGDSHCLVFHVGGDMYAQGAGLADQLAYEFGFAMDVLGVRGSGATPSRSSLYRRAEGDPSYLKGKKLIIWCFSAREFTQGQGWRKWPVAPETASAATTTSRPSGL